MGTIANELKAVIQNVDKTKEKINEKYDTAGMEEIDDLKYYRMPKAVEDIPVANTTDGTATENDILLDKVAYSQGGRLVGTIPLIEGRSYTPTTTDITIEGNQYLKGDQVIEGDPNLVPDNIKPGVRIFNVYNPATGVEHIDELLYEEYEELRIQPGWYDSSIVKIQTQEKTGIPGTALKIIEPDDEHVLSRVFIEGDEDLRPENIRKNVIIFDVVGELEEITKYNILYVVNVLKQVAYQQQVEYNQQFQIIGTTPVLDDYEFRGWSTDAKAENVIYQPGQTITNNLADKGGVSVLYAVLEEMNLNEMSLEISYQNGGKLSGGNEIATVLVNGGNLPTGYSNVNRDINCEGATFVSKFANETQISYDNQLKFTEVGIYPVIVTHRRKDQTVTATGTIRVAGSNGTMGNTGQMHLESAGAWYDSGWVPSSPIKGCYISDYVYNYKSGSGHNSNHDNLAVFAKTSSGREILLYDFGNQDHLKQEVVLTNLGTTAMIGNNYAISVGSFNLTKGDLQNTQWKILDTFYKSDDIRQLRFFAFSDHGSGKTCFQNATIDYDLEYEFDNDLYESEQN